MNTTADAPEAIEADFPGWHVFRGRDRTGTPKSWVASRLDPAAGTDPTVMCDTAEQLRTELAKQRQRAAAGGRAEA